MQSLKRNPPLHSAAHREVLAPVVKLGRARVGMIGHVLAALSAPPFCKNTVMPVRRSRAHEIERVLPSEVVQDGLQHEDTDHDAVPDEFVGDDGLNEEGETANAMICGSVTRYSSSRYWTSS
jgi:hypothetical protein